MRILGGLFFAVLLAGGLSAQYRGNIQPIVIGGAGNAVFPAGTSANNPGLTRVNPGVAYPGGGGPRLMIPGTTTGQSRRSVPGTSYVYAYPIYVPFYDPSAGYADPGAAPAPAPAPTQPPPNVVVIYGSQPAPPVETAHPSMQVYEPAAAQPAEETPPAADFYLFAFKDHSIYSAVAYWVDGDTLHYFTSGDTHRQAPLSTLDRDLTERLNRESGVKLKLPPVKQ
jgi:hypothetical protein